MKKIILSLACILVYNFALKADVKINSQCKVAMNNNVIIDTKGNWQNNSTAFTQASGKIIFSGLRTVNDTLLHNGTLKKIAFKKIGTSGFSLNSDLNVSDSLIILSGKVFTNAYNVNLGTTGGIKGEANGNLVVGKLSASRSVGTGSSNFGGIGVNIAAGASNIGTVTAIRTTGTDGEVNINGTKGILRKWQLVGTAPAAARNLSFSWFSDEDNSNSLSSMKVWNSGEGTAWHGIAENIIGTTHTITTPVTTLGYFTISSESPINLPSTIAFDEDNSKTINLATGLKGTGKYYGYFDDCTIYFADGKSIKEIKKGKSERAYMLSTTGNYNIVVSFSGMNATLTPVANWYGTESITFTLTETAKKSDLASKKVSLSKAIKSVELSKALESFFDKADVTVNAVNDAPVINSWLPTDLAFATDQQHVNFSVVASDVDNTLNDASYQWFVQKGEEAEQLQTGNGPAFVANFTNHALYRVRVQVSDASLNTSITWTVDASPSSIASDLLPTITEIQQNYPNPFNPQTTIKYSLKDAVSVSINVYNYSGQLVKTLVKGTQKPGYYSINWNAADVASGLYFYQMKAGDYQMIKRAVVIK